MDKKLVYAAVWKNIIAADRQGILKECVNPSRKAIELFISHHLGQNNFTLYYYRQSSGHLGKRLYWTFFALEYPANGVSSLRLKPRPFWVHTAHPWAPFWCIQWWGIPSNIRCNLCKKKCIKKRENILKTNSYQCTHHFSLWANGCRHRIQ